MTCPPILYLVFNRPDLVEFSFARIRKAAPKQLFVAADGPRRERIGEQRQCELARKIVENVDWPCQVQTLFRDENLGCRRAVSEAITWFFRHVEYGIILEDDCVADESFFRFCAALLEKHRNDSRIMCVTGDNFQQGQDRGTASYYFSQFPHCWGWATWRRAWKMYDVQFESWQQTETRELILSSHRPHVARNWRKIFDKVACKEIDSWAYIWTLSCWANSGLTCTPERNLVANIGFDDRATHTVSRPEHLAATPDSLDSVIQHPTYVLRNVAADEFVEDFHFNFKPPKQIGQRSDSGARHDLGRVYRSARNIARKSFRKLYPSPPSTGSEIEGLKTMSRHQPFSISLGGNTLCGPDGPSAYYSHREIFRDKIYDFVTDHPSPRIIDCGGNIGLSVIFFKNRFPDARITCVEADPLIAAYLLGNLTTHGVSDVEVLKKAVAAKEGKMRFWSEGADGGRIVDDEAESTQAIDCCTLDSLIDGPVDMLKIDIEGAETEAVVACTKLDQVQRMFIEYHSFPDRPQNLDAILAHAKSFGFRYIIRHQFASNAPFTLQTRQIGMDLQLNLFFWRLGDEPSGTGWTA